MNMKIILQKFFVKYGMMGAQSASGRGCHEMAVPNIVREALTKTNENRGKARMHK